MSNSNTNTNLFIGPEFVLVIAVVGFAAIKLYGFLFGS